MPEWLTVEVVDAAVPASGWQRAHGEQLVETAVTSGAVYWDWHETRWGVVLELVFPDTERLDLFRRSPALLAALDAAPDPVHGLAVYRGRGGTAGAREPRHPRPRPMSGAAAWPLPEDVLSLECARWSIEIVEPPGAPDGAPEPETTGC